MHDNTSQWTFYAYGIRQELSEECDALSVHIEATRLMRKSLRVWFLNFRK